MVKISKTNIKPKVTMLIIIGLLLILVCSALFIKYISDGEFKGETYRGIDTSTGSTRYLNWEVKETIHYNYEECKDINRHEPIKRLIYNDYMLPMCPEAYVVLYSEDQKIVFIFNQENENKENPAILTVSTTCDNSSGKC